MTETAIRIENLTRDFAADAGPVRAVDGLSLEVPAGIIFGFLGPNGAGKTTTIRLLLGLLEPTAGRAEVLGLDTQSQPEEVRARTGALLEYSGIYEHLSAEDNLEFYGRAYRLPAAERQARIKELLTDMGLWERRKDPVRTYSGGMKRRLALARALLHDPEIILFDEPTIGVDVQGTHALWEHIEQQQARGKTFIVSTNDMAEADALCDRLVIIDHGQAIAERASPHPQRACLELYVVQPQLSYPVARQELQLAI